jgi:hypothetical protein
LIHATVRALALPQGSSLRSGLCCPDPSTLNRPHPSHWQARSDFPLCGYTKRLSCAGAPRPPASGSVLSLQILIDMSPSLTPEKSVAALIQFLRHRRGLRPILKNSAFSSIPQIRFTWGGDFGASQQFACATTCRFVRPPDGSDSALALPARTFTSRLPPEQSPDPGAGYDYRDNWTFSTGRTLTDWICS